MGRKNIKNPQQNETGKIKAPAFNIGSTNALNPLFCFKYLDKNYHLKQCNVEEKANFISTLVTLSELTWQDIQQSGRHQLGHETINKKSLKCPLPANIKEEVNNVICFRFNGMMPMLGFRNNQIFHVVFIDRNHQLY